MKKTIYLPDDEDFDELVKYIDSIPRKQQKRLRDLLLLGFVAFKEGFSHHQGKLVAPATARPVTLTPFTVAPPQVQAQVTQQPVVVSTPTPPALVSSRGTLSNQEGNDESEVSRSRPMTDKDKVELRQMFRL